MRFPSLASLAERAAQVLRRFPWTLAAGTLAAVAGIVATTKGADDVWARLAFVAALGLPVTIALTLLAEVRGWPGSLRMAVLAGQRRRPGAVLSGVARHRGAARRDSLLPAERGAASRGRVPALSRRRRVARLLAIQPPPVPRLPPRRGVLRRAVRRHRHRPRRARPAVRRGHRGRDLRPDLAGRRPRGEHLDLSRHGAGGSPGAGAGHRVSSRAQGVRPIHPDAARLHLPDHSAGVSGQDRRRRRVAERMGRLAGGERVGDRDTRIPAGAPASRGPGRGMDPDRMAVGSLSGWCRRR